ncbi:MAG: hypothetical protein ACSLE5_15885 [Porticoccaceae bacterium]
MPQFLFVVEIPPSSAMSSSPGYPYEWTKFENEIASKLSHSKNEQKIAKASQQLHKNVWLIPAENGLQFLSILVASATSHGLPYSSVLIPDGAVALALDVKPKL